MNIVLLAIKLYCVAPVSNSQWKLQDLKRRGYAN